MDRQVKQMRQNQTALWNAHSKILDGVLSAQSNSLFALSYALTNNCSRIKVELVPLPSATNTLKDLWMEEEPDDKPKPSRRLLL